MISSAETRQILRSDREPGPPHGHLGRRWWRES